MTACSLRRLARLAYYSLKGFRLYPLLDELEASQHWRHQQLDELRDDKLRALDRHAFDTVPYYRRRMEELHLGPDDIRGVADLPKLPVLTRREVRDHGSELISSKGSFGKPIWNSTGGTTGEPLCTANDLYGTAWGNAA